MEIRELQRNEIPVVVHLWYETSVYAHSFISAEYWKVNKEMMEREYLPYSETYLALIENELTGFVSLVGNYLAAIFVKKNNQRMGVGTELLNFVKERRSEIELKVFKKNTAGIIFYKKNGFKKILEKEDEGTGEIEIVMKWSIR